MSTLRISGLASGMDTVTMVKELMAAQRAPLDKLTQKKQTLEWQRDQYREMNALLKELDDMASITGNGIGKEATFLKKTVTSTDDSFVTAKAINATNNVSTQIEVSKFAKSQTWKNDPSKINYTAMTGTLKFNVTDPGATTPREVEISVAETDTLDNIISKINASNLGVTAMKEKIDDGTGNYVETIVSTNSKTGAGAKIESTDASTQTFFENLGFGWTGNELTADTQGQDAIVKVNGYQMQKSSNTFTINGIEYTVKAETTSPVTISSTTDVDGILDSITQFVNKYNEIIEKINSKVNEERHRDYTPLTDEQKEAMTEKQIEQWEELAMSGMLRGDTVLKSALYSMRGDFYSPVSNSSTVSGFQQLSNIGITTTSNYNEGGKLIIDEAKLREKIQENPSAIYQLFNANGDTEATMGIAKRLRSTISDTISKIESKAGKATFTSQQYTIGRNLDSVEDQMERWEDKLTQMEDRYWSQFTAMEQAIQRANSQATYLSQFFTS
jgi:flagellar hook-associated protein 2